MPKSWAMAKPSGGSSDWEGRPSESGVSVWGVGVSDGILPKHACSNWLNSRSMSSVFL